jgi:tRNA dimethylallyltransferase
MNMRRDSTKPKVALIAGPTASGKSSLAMRLAESVSGTIINADSAQVYRDLRVLSARPTASEERALPHRLFGYIDGAEACSAPRWADDAKTAIAKCISAGKVPILVGGTGLYHRTLLDGIAPIPDIEPAIRADVRATPTEQLYAALEQEDPQSAARLHPADTARIGRAIEVIRSTGRTIGTWRQEKSGGLAADIALSPLLLLPNRDWLYARCDSRFATMFETSAVDEVSALLKRKLDPDLPVMNAIGVPEIRDFLAGVLNKDEAIQAAAQATRRYAKRQFTWFKGQSPEEWPRVDESEYDEWLSKMVTKLQ